MPIAIKITSYHRLTPGQEAVFTTDVQRFSIGRNRDNQWVLPDPQRFMSGTHCWLEERNGTWFLTDTSTNGVYLNGSDQRVEKNGSVAIADGDRIRLGDYELEVQINGNEAVSDARPSDGADPFHAPDRDVFAALQDSPAASDSSGSFETGKSPLQEKNIPLGDQVSIDELYHLTEQEDKAEERPSLVRSGDRASAMEQHFSAPGVVQQASRSRPEADVAGFGEIPDDWDDETGEVPTRGPSGEAQPGTSSEAIAAPIPPSPPSPASSTDPIAPTPAAQPAQGVAGPVPAEPVPPAARETGYTAPASRKPPQRPGSALAAFAAGAGLDVEQLRIEDEDDFFSDVGELLKTMTTGVMQAIASRGQIKSEFRLEQTMIAPTQNNPLKFSASAQEAMMRLLARAGGAYLSGPAAAAEAIDDVNAHQLAVLAGTEAALKSLLRRFDPIALEARFNDGSTLEKALPIFKKAKLWDFYRALYQEVSKATGDDFQKFFGSEFSEAYEKQLDRLKISRKE
jgi:type VI secretion system protein